MDKELFPMFVSATAAAGDTSAELTLAQECAWDFEHDAPIFRNGEPVPVMGAEAVKVWAYNALKTVRYRYEAWSFQYGSELESLIGKPFSPATKRAEVTRYIAECLTASPYISEVAVSEVALEDGILSASITLKTIYGEVSLDV